MLEFYNQDKSKAGNMPIFTDVGVEEFHLFEFEGSSLDLVAGDLEEFIIPEEFDADKQAAKEMLHLANEDDGGGKPPAKEPALQLTNEEQTANKEVADILLEEYGGEEEEVTEVEAEVEKEKDDESTEVDAEEVEGEASDTLLSPNRKEVRDMAHDNIDKHAKKIMKQAEKKSGDKPKLGDVVQLSVHEVDTTKLLPNHITAIVVDVNEQKNCVRIAVEKGVLKGWYNYMRVTVKAGVSAAAMGLGTVAYDKSNPPKSTDGLTEREALGSMSEKVFSVSTIGKSSCKCSKGQCNTATCPCYAAKMKCNSACHGKKGNINCKNYDAA